MVCSGPLMTTFQGSSRRIIFPTLHKNSQTTPDTSLVVTSHLKTAESCVGIPVKSSSIESDMPSLVSLSSNSEQGSISVVSDSDGRCTDRRTGSTNCFRYWNSKKKSVEGKFVRFDPRIWVHEFQRSRSEMEAVWYTAKEMNNFKSDAIQCIIAYNSKSSRKAGHIAFKNQGGSGKVLYSHPALGVDGQYDPAPLYQKRDIVANFDTASQLRANQFRDAVAETEVRNILIVNSHDVFLKLFAKGIRKLFPCAMIVTASTIEDARKSIEERRSKQKTETNRFDIVIVDEHLKKKSCEEVQDDLSSGASLLAEISNAPDSLDAPVKTLFVGVCTDFKARHFRLKALGADLVWQKPPPLMDECLRDTMLRSLLTKRGRMPIVKKLF